MAIVSRIKSKSPAVPYYLGVVTNKRTATTGKNAHTHYLLVSPSVAPRLGLPPKPTIKKDDEFVGGAVFDSKRKYRDATGATKTTDAKRSITPMSRDVELFTGDYVKDLKGKGTSQESYTVGFPATLSMVEILYFVHKRMPKVQIVRSGKKSYKPKNITMPKDTKIEATAVKEAK